MKAMRRIAMLACLAATVAGAPKGWSQDALDGYMRHLAVQGSVQIVNGTVATPGIHALTRFDISYRANWDYELTMEKSGAEFHLAIAPTLKAAEVAVKHTLKLPEGEEQKTDRYRVLLLHEYDHVAISTDGRARALLKGLLHQVGSIKQRWSGPIPPPADAMNALINQELSTRQKAVADLIAHAYRSLDRETDHGRRPLKNRSGFFLDLFTARHLKEANFPFMDAALKVTNTAEYKTAPRYYRF